MSKVIAWREQRKTGNIKTALRYSVWLYKGVSPEVGVSGDKAPRSISPSALMLVTDAIKQ
ncbi:hypothetical protein [Cernens ardua]|uniref:hypothetical protein n=1 Tax=Cernens ardua TaxID=3402176 RepID=UPI003F9C2C7E